MTRRPNAESKKKRLPSRRTFEIEITKDATNHLGYFIKQELGYYNSLIENLTPRLRTFPGDFMAMKDKEKKLWEACAEHAIDPTKMLMHSLEKWSDHLKHLHPLMFDQDGAQRISPAHINILKMAAAPARVHGSVRRSMAAEILKYMIGQSEMLQASLKTDSLKAPLQLLVIQSLDTKRHLQIPASLVKITNDDAENLSRISIPYSREPVVVRDYDLTEIPFKTLIVRAPHPTVGVGGTWNIDFKESQPYMVNLTDHNERRRR